MRTLTQSEVMSKTNQICLSSQNGIYGTIPDESTSLRNSNINIEMLGIVVPVCNSTKYL